MGQQIKQRSLLGEKIANRLEQLGLSRREFSRRFEISRPTLHDLEFNPSKQFADSTFNAIDEGLKWDAGTAYAFHLGIENARDIVGRMSMEERTEHYLEAIMSRLLTMTIEELERESLMLEEEMYGRPLTSDEASLRVIRETVRGLRGRMIHTKGKRQGNGVA